MIRKECDVCNLQQMLMAVVLRSWTSKRNEKWHRTEYFSQNNTIKYPAAWLLFSQWQAITSVSVNIAWFCHVTQCKNRLAQRDIIKVHNKLSRRLPILWNSCWGTETYFNANNNNWTFKHYLLRILCEGTQSALRGTELLFENALKWEIL